jgi:hypothetical protein
MTECNNEKTIVAICSFCKRIRDEEGIWKKVDESFLKSKDIELSHSVCPECKIKHYKGI